MTKCSSSRWPTRHDLPDHEVACILAPINGGVYVEFNRTRRNIRHHRRDLDRQRHQDP